VLRVTVRVTVRLSRRFLARPAVSWISGLTSETHALGNRGTVQDGPYSLAKVGVAGANPVVRSSAG
jgi:hypothetical protein